MEPTDPEVVELDEELRARIPGSTWTVWRGINGLLYARWRYWEEIRTFRGKTKGDVLANVGLWVATGREPDTSGPGGEAPPSRA